MTLTEESSRKAYDRERRRSRRIWRKSIRAKRTSRAWREINLSVEFVEIAKRVIYDPDNCVFVWRSRSNPDEVCKRNGEVVTVGGYVDDYSGSTIFKCRGSYYALARFAWWYHFGYDCASAPYFEKTRGCCLIDRSTPRIVGPDNLQTCLQTKEPEMSVKKSKRVIRKERLVETTGTRKEETMDFIEGVAKLKMRTQRAATPTRIGRYRKAMQDLGMTQVNYLIPTDRVTEMALFADKLRCEQFMKITELDVTDPQRVLLANRNSAKYPSHTEIGTLNEQIPVGNPLRGDLKRLSDHVNGAMRATAALNAVSKEGGDDAEFIKWGSLMIAHAHSAKYYYDYLTWQVEHAQSE